MKNKALKVVLIGGLLAASITGMADSKKQSVLTLQLKQSAIEVLSKDMKSLYVFPSLAADVGNVLASRQKEATMTALKMLEGVA